ncbi:aminotransferase class III-fold pyridoxal phosphate-dependent enzyme [Kineococcus sp. SYSU DK001]|uniref:aminotransferase class III-fold pyridoxal phosphate-dependent enzyme n=1 Tax=Kineococcus sp. SYSU DK001 TaxID=3383122 RepID=UPI003D7E7A06
MTATDASVRRPSALDEHRLRVLPGGFGRGPLAVGDRAPYARSAQGWSLVDEDGHELIDLNNNMTVNLHGHAHPAVLDAVRERFDAGLVSLGVSNEDELLMADALLARLPWAGQVRFANSGTEAVMLAVRVARARTGRDLVVVLGPGYHGTADAVLPALLDAGAPGVPDGVRAQTLVVPRGDDAALERVFDAHGGRIAAVVLDLCANSAGLQPLTAGFVAGAERLARADGALLVVDEVVTFRNGFGGLAGEFGVRPDLMALGKTIGGGFAVGAVVGTADALSVLDVRRPGALVHGGTFTANPVTMTAGRVTLDLFGPGQVQRLNALAERFQRRAGDGLDGTGWQVRRSGSVLRPFPVGWAADERRTAQKALFWAAYQQGLLLSAGGLTCLSTVMDEGVVDEAVARLVAAGRSVAAGR